MMYRADRNETALTNEQQYKINILMCLFFFAFSSFFFFSFSFYYWLEYIIYIELRYLFWREG